MVIIKPALKSTAVVDQHIIIAGARSGKCGEACSCIMLLTSVTPKIGPNIATTALQKQRMDIAALVACSAERATLARDKRAVQRSSQ